MEPESSRFPKTAEPLPDPLATLNSAFIDGLQAALVVIDREHRILLTNKFAQDWMKRTPEEMRGQYCFRLFHEWPEEGNDKRRPTGFCQRSS